MSPTSTTTVPTDPPPTRGVGHPRRRAALIATAASLPVVVLVALVIANVQGGSGSSGTKPGAPLPAVTVAAPPSDAAAQAPCTTLLEALPTQLGTLDPRTVVSNPSSPFVVGWGDPAVVLRCGVGRPGDLHPGSSASFQGISAASGSAPVYFDVTSAGGANVYTTVDRAVYIEISVPSTYAAGPMPQLAGVIGSALKAVCVGGQAPSGPQVPNDQLCAERP